MVITLDMKQENDDVKKIKVEVDKEKEVTVRYKIVSSKWKTWNRDNFSCDWNKNYSF